MLVALAHPLLLAGRAIKVHEARPPLAHRDAAETLLEVNGTGFADYGDTRCRFGGEVWTRATVLSRHLLRCHTPVWPTELMWHGVHEAPLEVSFTGHDYTNSTWREQLSTQNPTK